MTEIDFEALGRCHHVKDKLVKSIKRRDDAFSSIDYRYERTQRFNGTVIDVNMEAMHKSFKELSDANAEVLALFSEYNRWAEKAGERALDLQIAR